MFKRKIMLWNVWGGHKLKNNCDDVAFRMDAKNQSVLVGVRWCFMHLCPCLRPDWLKQNHWQIITPQIRLENSFIEFITTCHVLNISRGINLNCQNLVLDVLCLPLIFSKRLQVYWFSLSKHNIIQITKRSI